MIKAVLCAMIPILGTVAYLTRSAPQSPETPPSLPALTEENFARWRDFIRPKPAERRWQEIPWQSSLWEAARDAQKQDKPVLLWAMNGHPLACT